MPLPHTRFPLTLNTEVMTVPFKTQEPVVINTVYRIDVSDVSWYGAKYVCVPSDDLGYSPRFRPQVGIRHL